MNKHIATLLEVSHPRRFLLILLLSVGLATGLMVKLIVAGEVRAQDGGGPVQFMQGIDPDQWYLDHEIEHDWTADYLDLATGSPDLPASHGVYAWPFDLDSIGWSMQSYQDYGGTPYFHHGMDMMKVNGTQVFNRSGGQVVNIENYQPGNHLYWEVAVLDPDGYIWQYHHVDQPTIPQYIWNKYAEYQLDPINGGFIPADTHIGNIVYWPVWSYGKQFNHIHLNILASGGVYVNGFEFHLPLPDTDGPEIQAVGLLKNSQIYPYNSVEGDYSLYVRARDLILDNVYYLPPWEFTFSMDGGPVQTTWRFDTLPGGADRYAYLQDFYVVPPTCGDYSCRDYYIDLGFIPESQYIFPATGGEHTILVSVRDYAGNTASQSYTYTVIGPPAGTIIWQDDFETSQGWVTNPQGTDTATSGVWERGDPQSTYSSGPKQLGNTFSGLNDLVTGRLAGTSATTYDIDGGLTSIRSPEIALPVADSLTLSLRYYLAHGNTSSPVDFLRVSVVGSTTEVLFEELGAAVNDDGMWEINNANMDAFMGQTVYVLIEAADMAGESLVEAGIDNVLIVATGINQAPIADPQNVTTAEDTPVNILLTATDPNGDPLTFTVETTPTHGTLSGTAPNLVYMPEADFNGTDSFTFTASDGQVSSAPAVVGLEVTAVNDVPVADPQSIKTRLPFPVAITLSGWDVEGQVLEYVVITPPQHGMLSGSAPNLVYTPAPGYGGSDTFTFIVNDGELNSNAAVVSIQVDYGFFVPVVFR